MLAAVWTNRRAGRASAAAVADDLGAVFTKLTVIAKMTFAACTFAAYAAVGTKLIGGAVRALFATFLAYHVNAVGASRAASHADVVNAVFADQTVIAEIIIAAHAVTAGSAFGAQLVESAV